MRKIVCLAGQCMFCVVLAIAVGCGDGGTPSKDGNATAAKPGATTAVPALLKPTLLFKLPDSCSSPDGMCIGKDGYIYLSMNNKNTEFKDPCKIMRITPDDKLEDFCELPGHPDTKVCSPLGNGFGSDGNLYVADNQLFVKDAKMGTSRVLRVNIKDGKAG
jgi:hypothetical protein